MSVADLDNRTICDVVDAVRGITPLGRGYVRTYAAGRVTYDLHAREAYSYGRHFPLFRFVPGTGRHSDLFVINGDRWNNGGGPSRTGAHQESARRAIERTGIPSIVIPFSALDGAGIDTDTIRPLHVRPDTWQTVTVERRPNDTPQWRRDSLTIDADGLYRWDENQHTLGDSLFTAVRENRRARFLSSFDYNERPPLYFICEVPARGIPRTVEAAIDSLAPRAVHAARLNGKQVERQGDVFFIETSLTRETLADRGATFGRLTQWTRRAAPKPGEVTYTAPDRDKERRVARRELATARRLWRETFRASLERGTVAHIPDVERRERSRNLWRELTERHATELATVDAAGITIEADESTTCDRCRATIGEPCRQISGATAGTVYQCPGNGRYPLEYRQRREREDLKRETNQRRELHSIGPVSQSGQRRRWKKIRADRAERIETARRELRRATLTGTAPRGYGFGGKGYYETETEYRRRLHKQAVKYARENLERALASGTDSMGNVHNRHARDAYRARYGAHAISHWQRATDAAQRKYRPETVHDTARAIRDRETVRRHLMVYRTSHSATEVARVGSAVYVRGTVRHAVDLETGRRDGPDHRPLTLAADTWYLAVRNTVPRQNRHTRRNRARTES